MGDPVTRSEAVISRTEALVPIFRVADAHAAARWYLALGFVVVGEHRYTPELPLYLYLRRGEVHLHLSEHSGDAPPRSVAYLYVDDVDALATVVGAEIETMPWAREFEATDPDGNRLRIGTPRG